MHREQYVHVVLILFASKITCPRRRLCAFSSTRDKEQHSHSDRVKEPSFRLRNLIPQIDLELGESL